MHNKHSACANWDELIKRLVPYKINRILPTYFIATLTLGSQPRQGGCKVAGQEGDPGVTSHAPESAKSVRELPREFPCWELESQKDSQIFRT